MKKAELADKLVVAECKLHRIYKYLPSLEYMGENEALLHSMGYSEFEINLLFTTGSTYRKGDIINPETGEQICPCLSRTTIDKNPSNGKYEPYINGQQYMEFINSHKQKSNILEQLSVEHPEVADVLQENERLKQMITLLTNK